MTYEITTDFSMSNIVQLNCEYVNNITKLSYQKSVSLFILSDMYKEISEKSQTLTQEWFDFDINSSKYEKQKDFFAVLANNLFSLRSWVYDIGLIPKEPIGLASKELTKTPCIENTHDFYHFFQNVDSLYDRISRINKQLNKGL